MTATTKRSRSFLEEILTEELGCDMIDGVREVPLRSLAPGRRFELVLTATTPYPHKRIPGTVVRHGPGTSAVILDHAEKERSFTTKEGSVIVLHTSGGIQYWSPGTAVWPIAGERDVSRWTSKGGTGIGLTPDAESQDEVEERTSAMSKERIASLPLPGAVKSNKKAKAGTKAKAPKTPKELHDCLCGCGERVAGRFRQGHDGRYYSILKKVKSGEMTFNQMPRAMQAALKDKAGANRALAASGH